MSGARVRTALAAAATSLHAIGFVVVAGLGLGLWPPAAAPEARAAGADSVAGAEGVWRGTVSNLPLIVRLRRGDGAAWEGLLDSPNQGVTNFPLDGVRVTADSLVFALSAAGARFEGLRAGPDSVSGTWHQAGRSMPLGLRRGDADGGTRRPQEPSPPYPYRVEEVSYETGADGVRLAGTLAIPPGDGPFPAALLITGSGPENRDEEIFGHRPFLVVADDLARRGIAVLRVDDRGVGGSTGSLASATLLDLADDALAGLDLLRRRPEIAGDRVGLVGHSEGGLVAALAAERAKARPAFAVLLAAPAVPLDSLLRTQSALLGRAAGFPPERLANERTLYARLHRTIQGAGDSASVAPDAIEIVKALLAPLPEEALRGAGGLDAVAARQAATILTPAFRYFIRYDPEPALAALRAPVLALFGEKDTQVPALENAAAAERILRGARHPDATVRTLVGLNHLFQTAETGMISEYGAISETFAPAALDSIGTWIAARTAKGPPKPAGAGAPR